MHKIKLFKEIGTHSLMGVVGIFIIFLGVQLILVAPDNQEVGFSAYKSIKEEVLIFPECKEMFDRMYKDGKITGWESYDLDECANGAKRKAIKREL